MSKVVEMRRVAKRSKVVEMRKGGEMSEVVRWSKVVEGSMVIEGFASKMVERHGDEYRSKVVLITTIYMSEADVRKRREVVSTVVVVQLRAGVRQELGTKKYRGRVVRLFEKEGVVVGAV